MRPGSYTERIVKPKVILIELTWPKFASKTMTHRRQLSYGNLFKI